MYVYEWLKYKKDGGNKEFYTKAYSIGWKMEGRWEDIRLNFVKI